MDLGDVKYNPWSTDGSTAGLRNALLLAEKTGHIFRREDGEEALMTALDEMPSTKLIKVQRKMSEHNERLNEVNFDIQKRRLYHETKDITDIAVMEKRMAELKSLSDHLQMVVSKKASLIKRLQQPFVGDYIKIDAAFHRYASEFFSMLAPVLSDLTSHLDSLKWVNTNTFAQSQLDDLVSEVSGALASIQTNLQSVYDMSHYIHSLHTLETSHTHSHS